MVTHNTTRIAALVAALTLALASGAALAKDGSASQLVERALRIDRTLALRDAGRLIELSEELAKSDLAADLARRLDG